jgi:iduronate 2-sulfatase
MLIAALRRLPALLLLLLVALLQASRSTSTPPKRNVLFIVVDDMRPDLSSYNATISHTPNMDRLAATGMLFSRAYVSATAPSSCSALRSCHQCSLCDQRRCVWRPRAGPVRPVWTKPQQLHEWAQAGHDTGLELR